MKTVILALLDKAWPPEHSFVDGLLAGEMSRQPGIIIRLCVSRNRPFELSPRRYGNVVCLPCLHPRRGFGRFLNLWTAHRVIAKLVKREKCRGRQVVLFVRNDPIYLLAASLLRQKFDRLVFQSSFPHEVVSGGVFKRTLARLMYRLSSSRVDAITAVSPLGLKRVSKLFPKVTVKEYIPLLSDSPLLVSSFNRIQSRVPGDPVRFIYIGTHASNRRLDVIISAIAKAHGRGSHATFEFLGGELDDVEMLCSCQQVKKLKQQGIIRFVRKVPREEIWGYLMRADVGLSLPPPIETNKEMSPIKLAEYMGAGLAVLASIGIPIQEKFVSESGGGLLVQWEENLIAEAIECMSRNPEKLLRMKCCSLAYAQEHLQYSSCVPTFMRLINVQQ